MRFWGFIFAYIQSKISNLQADYWLFEALLKHIIAQS